MNHPTTGEALHPISPTLGEEVVEDDELDGEVGEGAQDQERIEAKMRKDPGLPSAEEIKRHNITHLPYRSWCAHCVRGRGVGHPHLSRKAQQVGDVPTIGADYHYMGVEGEEGTVLMLVIRCGTTKMIFDMVVTSKGVNEYMVRRVKQILDLLGYKKIIMKSDQESSLVALLDKVKIEWSGEMIPERSAVQDSQGNGMVESGVRTMGSQIRTLRSALEEHYGEIGSDHFIIAWMVEHAAFLVSIMGLGRDGKEPYRLLKGKYWSTLLYEFGEGIQCKPLAKDKGIYKMDHKLYSGIFVGVNRKTGEYLIGTENGIQKARDVYRRAQHERWDR